MKTNWQSEINRLRTLADRIDSGERTGQSAARSLRVAATRIESAVSQALMGETKLRRSRIKGPRKRTTPVIYAVEPSRRGPALCEYRSSSARPFKIPKPIYNAMVRVMSKVKQPTKFAQLDEVLTTLLGEPVPEYLPRSVIRFWIARDLITHSGAKFEPKRPGAEFRPAAMEAWRRAAESPVIAAPDDE